MSDAPKIAEFDYHLNLYVESQMGWNFRIVQPSISSPYYMDHKIDILCPHGEEQVGVLSQTVSTMVLDNEAPYTQPASLALQVWKQAICMCASNHKGMTPLYPSVYGGAWMIKPPFSETMEPQSYNLIAEGFGSSPPVDHQSTETYVHPTPEAVNVVRDLNGSFGLPTLENLCPDLAAAANCPEIGCPVQGDRVHNIIVHLNDYHKWPRANIADWLETLDIDLTIKPKPKGEILNDTTIDLTFNSKKLNVGLGAINDDIFALLQIPSLTGSGVTAGINN